MINDHLSTVYGRLLQPKLLDLEPNLVPSSQAVGSIRRGAILTTHCSWAFVSTAMDGKQSAGALFTDIRSAYYSIIRQYVVGYLGLTNNSGPLFRALPCQRRRWLPLLRF